MPTKNTVIVLAAILTVIVGFLTATSPAFAASKEKVLHSFDYKDGAYPYAPLIFDSAGNLYGTTSDGGKHDSSCYSFGCGTVFELTLGPNGKWTEKLLHSFGHAKDGFYPLAGMILDSSGSLYGTTPRGGAYSSGCKGFGNGFGCGVVFELVAGADGKWREKVLHSFGKGNDGAYPAGGLIFDAAGNLYGTTVLGGSATKCTYGCGTVFKLTRGPNGKWTEKVLYSFNGNTDGIGPYGSLVFDSAGDLYGAASGGYSRSGCGTEGCGVVFHLAPGRCGKWKEKILHRFGRGRDGFWPTGGLIFDARGNLYGTTIGGGTSPPNCVAIGCGTVFELMPSGNGKWAERVLHSFGNGSDGFSPYGGVAFDSARNMYGTTSAGGASSYCTDYYGCGTVFQLAPGGSDTWSEMVLYNFCSASRCADGSAPSAPLILDTSGNLYGTAEGGSGSCVGDSPCGVVFEIKR